MRRYKILGFKRRRLNLTDYEKRLKLLKSRKTRVTIRRSNKYLQVQFTNFDPKGDKVLLTTSSKALKKLGWNHSCKNIPAAYLTGLYASKLAKEKKIQECVLDTGLYSIVNGSVLFAALNGIVDGGLKVPHSKEIFPEEKRLKGEHTKTKDQIKKDFEIIILKVKGEK